jgi:hypothetical protein
MHKNKTIVALLATFGALLASAAHAAVLEGADAREISGLISETGSSQGVLDILGYVTERANPPIEYYRGTFALPGDRTVELSARDTVLTEATQVLDRAGIQPAVISGGTQYVEYTVMVACSTADHCTVEKTSAR